MNYFFTLLVGLFIFTDVQAQQFEYKVVTSVESIVLGGLGRSRIISASEDKDFSDYATERSDNKEKDQKNTSKRKDIRVKNYEETKLLNFYNLGGIRFQNIAANDAIIGSKINEMVSNGWDLVFVNTGVESDSGKDDGSGLFITRYIFRRLKE